MFSHAWLRAACKNCICLFVHKPSCGFLFLGLTLTNYYVSPRIHGPSVFVSLPPVSVLHFSYSPLLTPSGSVINVRLCVFFSPEKQRRKGVGGQRRNPASLILVAAHGLACVHGHQHFNTVIEYISSRCLCVRGKTHTHPCCVCTAPTQQLVITSRFPYRDERNRAEDEKRGMGTD